MSIWKKMDIIEKGLFGVGVLLLLTIGYFVFHPSQTVDVIIVPTPVIVLTQIVEIIPTATTSATPAVLDPVSYPIEGSENVMVQVGDIMVEVDPYGNPVYPELLTLEQMFPFVPAR